MGLALPLWSLSVKTEGLILFFKLFIYFWLHWVSIDLCRLSLVAGSRDYSLAVMHGLLILVASLVEHGPWVHGLQ